VLRLLVVLLTALPAVLAMVCAVVAVGVLFGWPWALLTAVPFLLAADHQIRPPRRGSTGAVR
jgi:hypothetical protein